MSLDPEERESNKKLGLPNFPFGLAHKVSDILCTGLLAANWIYPLYHLLELPKKIPMQYSFKGNPTWSGSKVLILILPLGATLSWYQSLFRSVLYPEKTLFPLKVPQDSPGKVSTLAKTLSKLLGICTQIILLAGSALLVKGLTVNKETRAHWIKNGTIAGTVYVILSYAIVGYLLRKE